MSENTSGRTLDHVAGVYDLLSPLMLFGMENRLSNKVIELLDTATIKRVLDIGCGTGTLTINIARRLESENLLVVGLDAAGKMIEIAREKAGTLANVRFDKGFAQKLAYPDESFDAAVSTFFFHHIDLRSKIETLKEIKRVLAPGGQAVILDVDVPTNLFGTVCAWSGYFLFRQDEIKENIRGQLRTAFDEAGFSWAKICTYMGYITLFKLEKEGA